MCTMQPSLPPSLGRSSATGEVGGCWQTYGHKSSRRDYAGKIRRLRLHSSDYQPSCKEGRAKGDRRCGGGGDGLQVGDRILRVNSCKASETWREIHRISVDGGRPDTCLSASRCTTDILTLLIGRLGLATREYSRIRVEIRGISGFLRLNEIPPGVQMLRSSKALRDRSELLSSWGLVLEERDNGVFLTKVASRSQGSKSRLTVRPLPPFGRDAVGGGPDSGSRRRHHSFRNGYPNGTRR